MDIEEGAEVYIPNDLRNCKLPQSFQFYDPIMNITHLKMTDDRIEYFLKKNKIIQEFEEDTIKYNIVKMFADKKTANIVDKNKNAQLDLQQSKYMKIKDTGCREAQSVDLIYVKESDVMVKRQKFLNFKSTYLLRMQLFKYQSLKLK